MFTRLQAAGTGVLPAEITSFVRRRREIANASQALGVNALVTLVGAAGVGKTG